MPHGCLRRRHIPPAMSPAQVAQARALRAQKVPYKTIERLMGFQRHVLSNAVNGRMAYKGFK